MVLLLLSGLFLVKFLKNYLKLFETGIDDGKLKLFGGDGDDSNVGGRGGWKGGGGGRGSRLSLLLLLLLLCELKKSRIIS